ncbi:MAG: DUF177 domain-containing protein [Myxococcota bacterium]|nr:DUF177 domain-containing protein [Myxococcota bacterium]
METSLVIDTKAVEDQPTRWTFHLSRDWCFRAFADCDVAPLDEPGLLEVVVGRTGAGYLVRGHVRVALAATCVRCLEPTPVSVDTRFDVLFEPGKPGHDDGDAEREAPEDEEDEEQVSDGSDVERFMGRTFALDKYVRDTVLLELPMNPRCVPPCKMPAGAGSPG